MDPTPKEKEEEEEETVADVMVIERKNDSPTPPVPSSSVVFDDTDFGGGGGDDEGDIFDMTPPPSRRSNRSSRSRGGSRQSSRGGGREGGDDTGGDGGGGVSNEVVMKLEDQINQLERDVSQAESRSLAFETELMNTRQVLEQIKMERDNTKKEMMVDRKEKDKEIKSLKKEIKTKVDKAQRVITKLTKGSVKSMSRGVDVLSKFHESSHKLVHTSREELVNAMKPFEESVHEILEKMSSENEKEEEEDSEEEEEEEECLPVLGSDDAMGSYHKSIRPHLECLKEGERVNWEEVEEELDGAFIEHMGDFVSGENKEVYRACHAVIKEMRMRLREFSKHHLLLKNDYCVMAQGKDELLNETIQEWKDKFEEKCEEVDERDAMLEDLKKNVLQGLKQEVQSLSVEIASARKVEKQKEKLTAALEDAREKLRVQKTETSKVKSSMNTLNVEKKRMQSKCDELADKCEEREETISQLTLDLDEMTTLKVEMTTLCEEAKEELEAMVERERCRLDELSEAGCQVGAQMSELSIQTEFITPDMTLRRSNGVSKLPSQLRGPFVVRPLPTGLDNPYSAPFLLQSSSTPVLSVLPHSIAQDNLQTPRKTFRMRTSPPKSLKGSWGVEQEPFMNLNSSSMSSSSNLKLPEIES